MGEAARMAAVRSAGGTPAVQGYDRERVQGDVDIVDV